jgi:prevent-host-death family protein
MKKLDVDEIKAQFLKIIDKASKGETFIITKSGLPVAKLSPLKSQALPLNPSVL